MPDTLPNIPVPKNVWIDLYAVTGITPGQPIIVENVGAADIYLTVKSTQPAPDYDAYSIIERGRDVRVVNKLGDAGAWAFSPAPGGKINVSLREGFQPNLPIDGSSGVGSGVNLDAWGRQKIVEDYSLFDGMFTFGVLDTRFIIFEDGVEVIPSVSTRATEIDGRLNVASGATAGNKTVVESRRHPRYQPNRGLLYSASLGFKGANNDGILRAGLFVQDENGAYFKTKGDGNLYACIRSLGVEIYEELITFPFAIDITLGNIYDIQMQWRGVGDIRYYAGNPTSGFLELVHKINFLNTLDESLSISNPSLSTSFYAENITQEVNLWCGCVDASAEGGRPSIQQYVSDAVTKTVSAGDGIIAIRSPNFINGDINTRDAELVRISITANKKSVIKAYRTRNPAAITGGTFSVFQLGSFLESNIAMTSVNVGLMTEFSTFILQSLVTIERDNPNPDRIEFLVVHGDYIVLVCDQGATVEIDVTLEFGEEA